MRSAIPALLLVSLASPLFAVVTFDDGGSHIVDSTVNDYLYVDHQPGGATTVTFNAGANVTGSDSDDDSVSFFSSIGIFNGGFFAQDIYADGDASITVSAGHFDDDVQMFDGVTIEISGGTIADNLELYDEAKGRITGGTIGGDVEVIDEAYLEILGGTFTEDVEVDGTVVIRGGTFLMQGIEYGLATAGGQIVIDGSGFALDGTPLGYGDLAAFSGNLTGTLADGSSIDVTVNRNPLGNPDFAGTITLIPEPTTAALMLAAAGVLTVRRQRPVGVASDIG